MGHRLRVAAQFYFDRVAFPLREANLFVQNSLKPVLVRGFHCGVASGHRHAETPGTWGGMVKLQTVRWIMINLGHGGSVPGPGRP